LTLKSTTRFTATRIFILFSRYRLDINKPNNPY